VCYSEVAVYYSVLPCVFPCAATLQIDMSYRRATNSRALVRKITYKDKASYASSLLSATLQIDMSYRIFATE